ncbi:flagellar basal body-associated FliL family protein [Brevibacillus daliensis]|uniref:flagellar basal body-associated FliL family protein n=1 Tax=Brevibacillus daliensis TaxID=2892995 RepID=UPI001E34C8B5|nr:flagellar basal body-associated FliL family protein [Brevibacillus daliensis]
MFQNKLLNMALIMLIGITLLGVAAFFLWIYKFAPTQPANSTQVVQALTANEMVEFSVETGEITTNLLTNNFVVVQFTLTTDGKYGKEELEKRMPQVRQIIIKTLAGLTLDDLKGTEGLNKLEAKVLNDISSIMQDGKIVYVSTTTLKKT